MGLSSVSADPLAFIAELASIFIITSNEERCWIGNQGYGDSVGAYLPTHLTLYAVKVYVLR